jgi:hypothetical protein
MYNKLFSKILDSSIWLEAHATRIVWVTFIAAMDQDGFVEFASVGNVAQRANVTLPEARAAVRKLESPDPDSGDPDHEGRRLERVPGGWMVLNALKYRELATSEVRREQTRARVRAHRQRRRNAPVTPGNDLLTRSETETEESEDQDQKQPRGTNSEALTPTTAARRRAPSEDNPGAVYLIAKDVIAERGVHAHPSDVKEEIKTRAARAGIRYEFDVHKAYESALHNATQRRS